VLVIVAGAADASQRLRSHKKPHAAASAPTRSRRARAPLYRCALLEDADSGKVLYEMNADMDWPPASMAKMMLLLIAQEEVEAGHFSPNDLVRVSERSAMTGGSRLGLRQGEIYPLGELMKAALIKSANDAAVAVAEKIAGSVEGCVQAMNQRAKALGLTHTAYRTVDGLPPRPTHDADLTNATDLARLGRELLKHTDLLKWSGVEVADFDNGSTMLRNTNHLVGHFEGCDGLKTGFTTQAGFNLTATAKRGDMRLIAVVLGAPSNAERFRQAARLMDWGFDNFKRVSVLERGQLLPVHVQGPSGQSIQPIAASEYKLVVPRGEPANIKLEYDVPPSVEMPVLLGASMGEVVVRRSGEVVAKVQAICPIPVDGIESSTRPVAASYGESGADGSAPASAVPAAPVQTMIQEIR
jgi:D-alanyl-D-alanine carboxypeptidase (penicillin-binding protein 5/6)